MKTFIKIAIIAIFNVCLRWFVGKPANLRKKGCQRVAFFVYGNFEKKVKRSSILYIRSLINALTEVAKSPCTEFKIIVTPLSVNTFACSAVPATVPMTFPASKTV